MNFVSIYHLLQGFFPDLVLSFVNVTENLREGAVILNSTSLIVRLVKVSLLTERDLC